MTQRRRRPVIRRIRAHLALFGLLGLLVAVATGLLTAAPRISNQIADTALRAGIADAHTSIRDLTVSHDLGTLAPEGPTELADERDAVAGRLPQRLRQAVRQRWYAVQSESGAGIADYFPEFEGAPPQIDVRIQDGYADAVRVVAGALPAPPEPDADALPAPSEPDAGARELAVQVAVSERTAEVLSLRVGSEFTIEGPMPLRVTVAGIVAAIDPEAPIWQDHPRSLHPEIPRPFQGDPPTYLATGLLHPETSGALQASGWPAQASFRYRLDEQRLHAGQAPALLDGLRQLDVGAHGIEGALFTTGLDHLVEQFQARRSAVGAVVAVVLAGLLGGLVGVLLLATRMTAERRREELRLWRARGGSLWRIAATLAGEAAVPVLPAALLGVAVGLAYPARTAGPPWPALAVAVLAVDVPCVV
ncbi:MAG: FtsX-like permease family protein, partial [Micromonosporaceae bacterium]